MRPMLGLCAALLLATAGHAGEYEHANRGELSPELRRWSEQQIDAHRKGAVELQLLDAAGAPLADTAVEIRQRRQGFCFGSAFNEWVREGNAHFEPEDPARFRQWFAEHFNCGTPASTLHWKLMEASPGEDGVGVWYADGAVQWLFDHEMPMLGHAVSWENPELVPDWVAAAPDAEALKTLLEGRIEHLVGRYQPWIQHWVGVNEMLDYDSLSKRFDDADFRFRPWLYQALKAYDPSMRLLTNEAHILAEPGRVEAYKELVRDLQNAGAEIDILGVQAHFWPRDQEFIDFETVKARLDSLAELGLPIWITEFDYAHPSETVRANQLEGFYRLAYAHPAVQAIKSWGFWEGAHWRADWGTPVALVERDWRVAESGRRLGALMREWRSQASLRTDADGQLRFRGFAGDYELHYTDADGDPQQHRFALPAGGDEAVLVLGAGD